MFQDGVPTCHLWAYLEVHFAYNLHSNCSYDPIICRVAVVMGLIIRL